MPGFSRIELDLGVAFELLQRTRNFGDGLTEVELGNIGGSSSAGIGHIKTDGDGLIIAHTRRRNGKVLVTE